MRFALERLRLRDKQQEQQPQTNRHHFRLVPASIQMGALVRRFVLRWSSGSSKEGGERETTFRERFDLEQATPGGVKLQVHVGEGGGEDGGKGDGAGAAFVVAVASVDQAWGAQLAKGSPDVGPQVRFCSRLFRETVC